MKSNRGFIIKLILAFGMVFSTMTNSSEATAQALQLGVGITPSQVPAGGTYTLSASYIDHKGQLQQYDGKLLYNLRFCQLNNSNICQTSSGAWGNYTLVNGRIVINLPTNTPVGIYNVSFKPADPSISGLFEFSNEASVTVTSKLQLTLGITPVQVAPGGSYTLTANYADYNGELRQYNGRLLFKLRFCSLTNSSSCQISEGSWGSYSLTNGSIVINLPSNTPIGIYNVSFKPADTSLVGSFDFSNEVSITVNPSAPVATGNLVINGSFEEPANLGFIDIGLGGYALVPNGTAGIGWNMSFVNPSQHIVFCTTPLLEIQRSAFGWNSANGQRHAELDSDCASGNDALVNISQTIATQPGALYKVSFAFAARPGTGSEENRLSTYFGGQLISEVSADGGNFDQQPTWNNYVYFVTATSNLTEIRFSPQGTVGNTLGVFIDDVKVERVQ